MGEKETEVIFSIDGSFKSASSNDHNNESHDKALANQLGGHALEESPSTLDGPGNMLDLTGEDDEMDTTGQCEPVDTKPVVHPNVQAQSLPSVISLQPLPGSNTELTQCSWMLVSNSQSPRPVMNNSLPAGSNSMPQVQIGGMSRPLTCNYGLVPVSTNAVPLALSQQRDSSQGVNFPISSMFSTATRNFTSISSAIQALPSQAANTSPQHARPLMSLPTASRPPASFWDPAGFNNQSSGSNVELQHHLSQLHPNPSQIPNMASFSAQNHSLSLVRCLRVLNFR